MVRISDRLRTVAHMCNKGAVVADIGTDHGYLPIYLVQEGIAPSAIAMDLRKGPLEKAKKHICDNCLEDRIQTRLSDGLEKLSENEDDIIIFIDEIHTIVGAGGAEGAIDASNILKPALARGEIKCIGATTIDEYRKHIEN